jgi:diguanylate cyclase (GGDEF)-like protein/PAS domain S-box-containing protein
VVYAPPEGKAYALLRWSAGGGLRDLAEGGGAGRLFGLGLGCTPAFLARPKKSLGELGKLMRHTRTFPEGTTAVNNASSAKHVPANQYARAIEAGQIDLLYEQAPSSLFATSMIGILLVSGLWNSVSKTAMGFWLGAVVGLSAGRYWLLWRYRRSRSQTIDSSLWKGRFLAGVAINGLLWGGAGVYFFVPQSYIHQTLLAFVLAGMSAGAVSTLSPLRGASLVFLFPALVPYTIRVFAYGGQVHMIMSSMVVLFGTMMWMISQRLHATVEKSLRLRFENLDLVSGLMQARDLQDVAHRALAAEIEEKQQAQRALQESHVDLERRVETRTCELAQIGDRLAMEKELFRITLASIGDGVITTDRNGTITYLNLSAEHLTGWRSAEVEGKPLATAFCPAHESTRQGEGDADQAWSVEGARTARDGHLVLTDRQGVTRDVHHSAAPILDRRGDPVGTVLTFRDISEESRLAERLSHQAAHDALTGLVNRREFERRLDRVLHSPRPHDLHALIFMDLDQFKVVNDTCGHVAGDELLRQIAALMRTRIRASDTFARLGGDEFGILLERCPVEEAVRIAHALRELAQSFRFGWQDKSFIVGISLGLVEITDVWENSTNVLRAADSACYMAKDRGRNRVYVYKPDDHIIARRFGEMQWMPRIQQALADGRLRLYQQPIVPMRLGQSEAELGEILVRLLDERGVIVLPGAFLPAAERYGQISTIDRWVVGETVDFLKTRGRGSSKIMLSVNLSGQSFSDQDVLDFIVDRIKSSRIMPSSLCFEVTETAAISDLTSALAFITSLRALGCRFSLDDFGSGLSSFGYLKTLPVDYLKIDGRFVEKIPNDRVAETMVEAIHRLGHVMGLKTIAEWVENAETLERLRTMNVDYAQGFHVGPPRPM